MAERSFAQEVGKLRIGEGEEFRGEGILAVTKALLQSGVGYVVGYQGAPISHLMDVLSDAQGVLAELGVHFEASASEAAAAAMLAASVNYPIRGAVTWKSTVGTNVASDALANVASGGVTGGALIIIGEDYGEGSSIMQERSHAFAMKSQVWLLDPRPNPPGNLAPHKLGTGNSIPAITRDRTAHERIASVTLRTKGSMSTQRIRGHRLWSTELGQKMPHVRRHGTPTVHLKKIYPASA